MGKKELTPAELKKQEELKAQRKAKQDAEQKKPLPKLKLPDGKLAKLKGKDFPKTREGRLLFCDFQIARWLERKDRIAKGSDPKARLAEKAKRLREKLAELEKELAANG